MGSICGKCLYGAWRIVNHRIALLVRHKRIRPAVGKHTVIDKRTVSRCHFPHRNAVCELAECHRSIGTVIRDEACHTQLLNQIIVADFRRQFVDNLRRNRVERILKCFKNRHQAVVITTVILWEPACPAQGNIRLIPNPCIRSNITKLRRRAVRGNRLKG